MGFWEGQNILWWGGERYTIYGKKRIKWVKNKENVGKIYKKIEISTNLYVLFTNFVL